MRRPLGLLLLGLWAAAAPAQGLRLDPQASEPPAAAAPATAPGLDSLQLGAGCAAEAPRPAAWSLPAAIQGVVCHALGVRRGAGLVQQARAADQVAGQAWWPALNAAGGLDARNGYGQSAFAELRADIVLFDFGQRSAAARESGAALAAALDAQRAEVLTAIGQAALLYTTAQAAQDKVDALAGVLRQAEANSQLVEARRSAGAASLAERYRADTATAQARAEHARALGAWLVARGTLAVALGLPASEVIELEAGPVTDEGDAPDLDALIAEARERHPQVLAARARLAEVQARIDGARAGRWGSIGASAQTGRTRSSNDLQVRSVTTGSLSWSLPLYDRGVTSGRVADAQAQQQVRQAELADALAQTEALVWEQGRLLQSERHAWREMRRARDSAEAALQAVAERYRLGVGSFGDVLQAQDALAQASLQWADSRAAWLRARWRLAAAVGRLGPLAFE